MPLNVKSEAAVGAKRAEAHEALARPLDLQRLEDAAREIFGPDAETWLDAENTNLGGRTPREMLQGCNKDVVRELLDNIRFGAFS